MVEWGNREINEPLSPPKGGYQQDVNSRTHDASLQPDSRDGSSDLTELHNYDVAEDVTLKSRMAEWAKKTYRQQKHAAKSRAFKDWIALFLPCVGWLAEYNIREYLPYDMMAGVSIAFMVVPQGMSYAVLAGLPPVYGLYGAFVPVLVYSALGSSKHLAVGPVAVTSLLLGQALRRMYPEAEGIEDAANPGDLANVQNDMNTSAIQITVMVGVLYSCIGIFQLTFLANFLSHSVISGFTTGAACIIGLSQIRYLLGVKVPGTDTALEAVIELIKAIPETQWREFVMGFTWLIALTAMKHVSKSYPKFSWLRPIGPITVVTIAILTVVIGKLDTDGNELIRTVQTVPKGLPPVTVTDWFPMNKFSEQLKIAIILCLVDFMESTSIAKAVARRHKYEINVNQEIIAMGLANILGSMFSSYTTTGSFSRSAVSSEVGAKRQLAGTITGVCVMLVLLFITPVFERVPYNVMGAIVLSSVLGLLEISEAVFLFKANFLDFLVWMSAFLGTIFLGVEIGLLIAIGLAVVLVVYQSAFPHTAVLGNLPGTEVYRNKKQYPSAREHPHLCIVRIDAPIYFANVEWIRGRIDKYRMRADKEVGPVFFVILDLSPVPFIDSNGMHALHEVVTHMQADGQQLVLANPSKKVRSQLKRVDLWTEIGEEWVFVRTADAVKMCLASVQKKLAEAKKDCDVDIGVGV